MNYSQLSQAIQDYCESTETDFVTNIPTFVRQAEDRIFHTIEITDFRKTQQGTTTASNRFLATPTDFLIPISLHVIDGTTSSYLMPKQVSFIREAYPSTSVTGLPRYYALWDDNTFVLGPTPDDAYTVELNYYYKPASIVDAGTSWIGDNIESVLLYGCLVEAYGFLKGEPDMMKYYDSRYKEALELSKLLGERKLRRDQYRNNEERV